MSYGRYYAKVNIRIANHCLYLPLRPCIIGAELVLRTANNIPFPELIALALQRQKGILTDAGLY